MIIKKVIYRILVTVSCVFIAAVNVNAQTVDLTSEQVEAPFGNLEQTPRLGNVVYAKQPDVETIKMLKDKGFKMVVSVKFHDEETDFNERKIVEENGMSFVHIPYYKGSYDDRPRQVSDAGVAALKEILDATSKAGSKVLLHCASGQRASATLGAVLYRDYGYSKEEAFSYAEKAGLTSQNAGPILKQYMENLNQ